MDDPAIAEAARITALRDQWLIQRGKANKDTKARMKKAAQAEKKEKERSDKAREKNQQQSIRRLAISNRQAEVGAFRAVLSDPHTEPSSDPPVQPQILQTPELERIQVGARAALYTAKAKKKANGQSVTNRLNAIRAPRPTTPPPIQMELIRPGKRKVKVQLKILRQNECARRQTVKQPEWPRALM